MRPKELIDRYKKVNLAYCFLSGLIANNLSNNLDGLNELKQELLELKNEMRKNKILY